MSKLTAKRRNALPEGKFGISRERKYPVNDRSHAIAAKSRASQQFNAGNLSASQKQTIDKKANAILNKGA